jgi:hypothetical protein
MISSPVTEALEAMAFALVIEPVSFVDSAVFVDNDTFSIPPAPASLVYDLLSSVY